jgi:hypothetical protein
MKTVTCIWCDEPVTVVDRLTAVGNSAGQVMHYECSLRSVIGSVGHQQRRCSCYGGDQEDPPGLTRREAAKAAAKCWFASPASRA